MIPLHIETAGLAVPVPFEHQPPYRPADARGKIIERAGRARRNQPAGECGARLRRAGLAEKEAHDAALAGAEREASACGQVELLRRAADLGDRRGQPAAAQPLLEDPERLSRPADL